LKFTAVVKEFRQRARNAAPAARGGGATRTVWRKRRGFHGNERPHHGKESTEWS
jgi:hypothetical protein